MTEMENKLKKIKVSDVVLLITSLIFVVIYLAGIHSAFAGVHRGFLDSYEVGIYGMDAFKDTFQLAVLMLGATGILPLCCIYNIAFGLYKWRKNEFTKFEKFILGINLTLVVVGIILFVRFL